MHCRDRNHPRDYGDSALIEGAAALLARPTFSIIPLASSANCDDSRPSRRQAFFLSQDKPGQSPPSAGERTRITHPDGTYFIYTYDGLNRPTYLSTATSWALNQNYFDHGAPWITTRVNGTSSGWFYDGIQRPWALGFYPMASTHNAAFAYGRNAAGQITSVSRDNDRAPHCAIGKSTPWARGRSRP